MEEKSRTEYSAKNTTVAMISRMLAIVMGYLTRVVFTMTLSKSYVGVNGLFTDILNVLALSELGVGTAITYALYKPIATKDVERQKSLMKLFQRIYLLVAGFIAVAGLALVPFLPVLVRDAEDVEHMVFIYLLYLLNSVLSYLFVYKKTLIDAHQLSYIGVLYHTIFLLVQDVLQIIVLFTTGNFILFLLIYLGCTLGNNFLIARKADQLYPYLKEKDVAPLPKEEQKSIFANIRAMLMHKIGTVVVNNTDNLLLSSMVGIVSAGLYSNYYLIIASVRQVLDQAFQGITASVGNLGVTEDRKRLKRIFEACFFIGQWLYGFAAICLYELLNSFVEISFGADYVFGRNLVLVLCINFFINGMRQATLVFRDSLGLFWYDRYKSLFEAGINLVVSILLTWQFGIIGVFLGTFISTVTTSLWVEPYVLYRKNLKTELSPYFIHFGIYTAVILLCGVITDYLCGFFEGGAWKLLLLRLPVCMAVPNVLLLLCYHRTKEFRFLVSKGMSLLRRRFAGKETGSEKTENRISQDVLSEAHLSEPQQQLLLLLQKEAVDKPLGRSTDWHAVFAIAKSHAVLPLLYHPLEERQLLEGIEEPALLLLTSESRKAVQQSYRLLYRTYQIQEALDRAGVKSVVLKGTATASVYPVPEMRKSGDVDMLLFQEGDLKSAEEALKACGYKCKEDQTAVHHLVMESPEGIDVELHTMLAEPFDNARMNQYMEHCLKELPDNCTEKEIMGYPFWILKDGYHAYELLLHMLQHYLRSGFGLKLLCDWCFFWNRPVKEEETALYHRLVRESGLSGFSSLITTACTRFLGLSENSILWKETTAMEQDVCIAFMQEIFRAEEFGKTSKERMVMLRGTGFFDYIREFHHQMHLNYPRAGKVVPLWPVLWGMTFIRFWRNNRKIRNTNMGSILKEAGRRSKINERIGLFRQ